jgi:hypothetical protein
VHAPGPMRDRCMVCCNDSQPRRWPPAPPLHAMPAANGSGRCILSGQGVETWGGCSGSKGQGPPYFCKQLLLPPRRSSTQSGLQSHVIIQAHHIQLSQSWSWCSSPGPGRWLCLKEARGYGGFVHAGRPSQRKLAVDGTRILSRILVMTPSRTAPQLKPTC